MGEPAYISRRAAGSILAVAILCSLRGRAAPRVPPFVVIVNPDNRISQAKRGFLEDAFLKRVTRWRDDDPIRPVDLRPNAQAREKFSKAVLKRSVAAVRRYWQQRVFSGRGVPPPEMDTDEAVVGYVLRNRGAIGYVSGSAELRGARRLEVR